MSENSIEKIINELSKIESLSNKITYDTEQKRDEYARQKEEEFMAFSSELELETSKQIEVMRKELNEVRLKELEEMRERTEMKLGEMEERFTKECVQEAKMLVDRIIKE